MAPWVWVLRCPPVISLILIVDDCLEDSEWVRKQLRKICVSNPCYVVTSGKEALAYIDGQGEYADRRRYPFPKILLLDWRMPGMSGFELLGEIQRRRECKDMLAIALSGLDDLDCVRRAYLSGAAAFIEKPCLPADFEALIQQFPVYWEHSDKDRLALTPAGA